MKVTKEGRELLDEISGKSKLLEEVDELTKKYKQPTAEDVTEMLGKKVTEEILMGNKQ